MFCMVIGFILDTGYTILYPSIVHRASLSTYQEIDCNQNISAFLLLVMTQILMFVFRDCQHHHECSCRNNGHCSDGHCSGHTGCRGSSHCGSCNSCSCSCSHSTHSCSHCCAHGPKYTYQSCPLCSIQDCPVKCSSSIHMHQDVLRHVHNIKQHKIYTSCSDQ